MLIDKIRDLEKHIEGRIKDEWRSSDKILVSLSADEMLEMAQALIAVDDVLKKTERLDGTVIADEIRKAIESKE